MRPVARHPARVRTWALAAIVVLLASLGGPSPSLASAARGAAAPLGAPADAAPGRLVTTADDHDDGTCDADCSLRDAIHATESGAGGETIRFDLPTGSGPIQPTSPLPTLVVGDVTIDGRPLAGDGTPTPVILDGSNAGGGTHALTIDGSGVTVQGLTIRAFGGAAVRIAGHDNLIGGPLDGDGNTIVDNGLDGIAVAPGDLAVGNTMLRNVLAGNRLSINLGERDPSALSTVGFPIGGNWPTSGPNHSALPPDLQSPEPGSTTVTGRMFGRTGQTNRIDVYWAPSCPRGRPEATTWLGQVAVSFPNLSGPPVPFSLATGPLPVGFVTATTTDVLGDTSELAACRPITDPFDVRVESVDVEPPVVAETRIVAVTVSVANDGPGTALGTVVAVGWLSTDAALVTMPSGVACDRFDEEPTTYVACSPDAIPPGGTLHLVITLRALTAGDLQIDAIATFSPSGDTNADNDTFPSTVVHVTPAAPTAVGTNVQVSPADPATGEAPVELTFGSVTGAGRTSVVVASTGPAVPAGFRLGEPPAYYDIETEATFSGAVVVCVTYDPTAYPDESGLRLYHYDDMLPGWQDVTTSHDPLTDRICGTTTSLSPFAVLKPDRDHAFTGFFAPVDDLPVLNRVKGGQAVPVKFSLGGDQGLDVFVAGSPSVTTIPCAGGAPVDPIETTSSASTSGLSFDPSSGRYTYVWKTDKRWTSGCRELVLAFRDGTVERAQFSFAK
jgi:CSLREA domain-containing protein